MQMKNSYIGYFKKDSVKKQEEVDQKKAKDTKFAFDKVFEMDDEKRIICKGCKKKLMQRKYSLGGAIFKGEGWGSK